MQGEGPTGYNNNNNNDDDDDDNNNKSVLLSQCALQPTEDFFGLHIKVSVITCRKFSKIPLKDTRSAFFNGRGA